MLNLIINNKAASIKCYRKADRLLLYRFKCNWTKDNGCIQRNSVGNISNLKSSKLFNHKTGPKIVATNPLYSNSKLCQSYISERFLVSMRESSTEALKSSGINRGLDEWKKATSILTRQQRNYHSNDSKSCSANIQTGEKLKSEAHLISPTADPIVKDLASKDSVCNAEDILSTERHLMIPKFAASPKALLHNAYNIVAKELNDKNLKEHAAYHPVKTMKLNSSWNCVYHVKWPDTMKFAALGRTKQEASHKAALACLMWLRKHNKIDKEGQPILVDKEQHVELLRKSTPTLNLKEAAVENLQQIVAIHQKEFMTKINVAVSNQALEEVNEEGETEEAFVDHLKLEKIRNQTFLGINNYFAKEKVALPVADYKEKFIEMLANNSVVIIKGEPGCGKSTRIPQYVMESWIRDAGIDGTPCRIAVTQPRRIAAISLAERVSNERDENVGHIVGYQVRLRSRFNRGTGRILYCTTGILLRHLQSDPSLSSFTHIILDEAHERDVNTDLLMAILKKAIMKNPGMKLIIMSATINTDLFQEYFNEAPLLHVPGFAYPVEQHFLEDIRGVDLQRTRAMTQTESPNVVQEDVVRVIEWIHKKKPEGAILCFLPGWEDISKIQRFLEGRRSADMSVLCLHSRLNAADQHRIFSRPPPGVRKVILATNIAETSVTIDDVVYVVDTGIHKESRFDNDKGILCIDSHWISKSSMTQRKGRAGRVQAGESFHLYPKSKFESFPEFTVPEILRTSLTKIVLDSKIYTNNENAMEFMDQLLTPPEKIATRRAVRELKDLELLDSEEKLTPLGKTLAEFQLEPKLGKALVNSVVYKCVTPVVDIITLFSADTDIFSNSLIDKDGIKRVKQSGCKDSDHLAVMRLFEKWLDIMCGEGEGSARSFCRDNGLIHEKLKTIEKLRNIHFDYLQKGLDDCLAISDKNSDNDELVKSVLLSGVGTLLQHRTWDVVKGRYKKSNLFITNYNQKATITSDSVNFKKTTFPSDFLVYINEVRSNIRRTIVVRETSVISPLGVLLFSNRPLRVKDTVGKEDPNVVLYLEDTKVEFLCDRNLSELVLKCREAINTCYQYFIFQMTAGGEFDAEVNKIWDDILGHLDAVFSNTN